MDIKFLCICAILCGFIKGMPEERGHKKIPNDNLRGRYGDLLDSVTNAIVSDIQYIPKSGKNDPIEKGETELEGRKPKYIPEERYSKNCYDLLRRGNTNSGLYTVYPFRTSPTWGIDVKCDQTTYGGGWTVILNRDSLPIEEDFNRMWFEYKLGFGNLSAEFWLGLDNIRAFTNSMVMELRIDMEANAGPERYAKYSSFFLEGETYILNVGTFAGTAGDGLRNHNGKEFNFRNSSLSGGSWWLSGANEGSSNLNGVRRTNLDGIKWNFIGRNNRMKRARMMLRPAFRA